MRAGEVASESRGSVAHSDTVTYVLVLASLTHKEFTAQSDCPIALKQSSSYCVISKVPLMLLKSIIQVTVTFPKYTNMSKEPGQHRGLQCAPKAL